MCFGGGKAKQAKRSKRKSERLQARLTCDDAETTALPADRVSISESYHDHVDALRDYQLRLPRRSDLDIEFDCDIKSLGGLSIGSMVERVIEKNSCDFDQLRRDLDLEHQPRSEYIDRINGILSSTPKLTNSDARDIKVRAQETPNYFEKLGGCTGSTEEWIDNAFTILQDKHECKFDTIRRDMKEAIIEQDRSQSQLSMSDELLLNAWPKLIRKNSLASFASSEITEEYCNKYLQDELYAAQTDRKLSLLAVDILGSSTCLTGPGSDVPGTKYATRVLGTAPWPYSQWNSVPAAARQDSMQVNVTPSTQRRLGGIREHRDGVQSGTYTDDDESMVLGAEARRTVMMKPVQRKCQLNRDSGSTVGSTVAAPRRTVKLKNTFDTHEIYGQQSASSESVEIDEKATQTPRKNSSTPPSLTSPKVTARPKGRVSKSWSYSSMLPNQGSVLAVDYRENSTKYESPLARNSRPTKSLTSMSSQPVTQAPREPRARKIIKFAETPAAVEDSDDLTHAIPREETDKTHNTASVAEEEVNEQQASTNHSILIPYDDYLTNTESHIVPDLSYWFEDEWDDICKRNQLGTVESLHESIHKSTTTLENISKSLPLYMALPIVQQLQNDKNK